MDILFYINIIAIIFSKHLTQTKCKFSNHTKKEINKTNKISAPTVSKKKGIIFNLHHNFYFLENFAKIFICLFSYYFNVNFI